MSDTSISAEGFVDSVARPFNLVTPFKYLIGDREAIRTIAATPNAVWFGLLLVITAGIAREYDGEDLVHEPWYLLIPVVASLLTSLLLFGILWNAMPRGKNPAAFFEIYERFLSLYWLTAPLAWIYAIPVERFLSAAEATRWNLIFLLIVSLWRVLLITRVVAVLFRVDFWRGFFPVMFFADIVVLVVLYMTPLPVLNIMGGVRLTASESMIQGTMIVVGFLSVVTFPVWFIGMAVAMSKRHGLWEFGLAENKWPVPNSVWIAGGLILLAWIGLATQTQPQQQLRRRVEQYLYNGQVREGLVIMSAHERDDFPPHWEPPPHVGYGKNTPQTIDLIDSLLTIDAKPWVERLVWEKVRRNLGHPTHINYRFRVMDHSELERYLTLFESIPEGKKLLREYRESIVDQADDEKRPQKLRARLKTLLDEVAPSAPSDAN